jgi:uncharacterized membrane protein YoaK (UPF0700 family)
MDSVSEARRQDHVNVGPTALSLASGCTDVLSFLKLGDLFTSAMTGNIALLAISIGRGGVLAASQHLVTAIWIPVTALVALAVSEPEREVT